MKTLFLKENISAAAAVIFFTLVAALFYFTSRQGIENGSAVQSGSPVPSVSEEPQTAPPNNAVNVKEDTGNHTTVRYEKESFTPRDVTIANETGCFIEIQNESENNLTPRLGPYDPKKERGFSYPPIPPHGKSLIDPRYGAIVNLSFYGKENPGAQFNVHVDPTCL